MSRQARGEPGSTRRVTPAILRGAWLPALLVAIVAGVLHRQAAADPWADDRILVAEPSWFQMAAPRMDAALPDASSIAAALTRTIDPWSRASTAGDIRALAACLAALAAGTLFLVLDRLRVPWVLAVPLAFTSIGLVLPSSTATSVTLALHELTGAALLLWLLLVVRAWIPTFSGSPAPAADAEQAPQTGGPLGPLGPLGVRGMLVALVASTFVGVLNHPSFLAAATVAWIAAMASFAGITRPAASRPPRATLAMVGGVALVTLAASLGAAAWLAYLNAASPIEADVAPVGGVPGVGAIAWGLLTGRFPPGLQPGGQLAGLREALSFVLPGAAILAAPLAAAAFMRRDTRRLAWMLAGLGASTWIVMAGTWWPDPSIAAAPARIAIVALAALGLTWLAAEPTPGARVLAIVAAIALGGAGFVDPARGSVSLQTARMQAFVESASLLLQEPASDANGNARAPASADASRHGSRDSRAAASADRDTAPSPSSASSPSSSSASSSGSQVAAHDASGNRMRWVSERLAIDRALLLSGQRSWTMTRLPAQAGLVRALPDDVPLVLFPEARARFEREAAWARSIDLPYPTAGRFVASQPEASWIALAVHDEGVSPDPFYRDLLTTLDGAGSSPADATASLAGLTALGRLDGSTGGRGLHQRERLDMAYGQRLGNGGWPVPARFTIDTAPAARVTINGLVRAEAPQGIALVLFDPNRLRTEEWLLGTSPDRARPTIRDTRLQAAYLLADVPTAVATGSTAGTTRSRVEVPPQSQSQSPPQSPPLSPQDQPPVQSGLRPRLPVLPAVGMRIPLDATTPDWFGNGWHGPERGDSGTFRWTNAEAAEVRVLVSHRRPLRVKIRGSLSAAPGPPNGLGLSWNDAPIHEPAPWKGEGEWTVPAALVRRGLNILTIRVARVVTPGTFAPGGDPRPLGAAIDDISIAPAAISRP